jgi:hypothetical protein
LTKRQGLNLIREVAAEAETVMDRDELLDPETEDHLKALEAAILEEFV